MAVHDPAAGSCQLLLEAARVVARSGQEHTSLHLSGTELNEGQWALGRAQLWACGLDGRRVVRRNALLTCPTSKIDRVVSQPPFGWRADADVPRTPIECAFVDHILGAIGPQGRAVVMLPERFLYHRNAAATRTELIDRQILEAVLRLPPRLLFGSASPACAVVLDPRRTHNHVAFPRLRWTAYSRTASSTRARQHPALRQFLASSSRRCPTRSLLPVALPRPGPLSRPHKVQRHGCRDPSCRTEGVELTTDRKSGRRIVSVDGRSAAGRNHQPQSRLRHGKDHSVASLVDRWRPEGAVVQGRAHAGRVASSSRTAR